MSRKNTLLTALLVVVIAGGFMLCSKEEHDGSFEDEGVYDSYASSDDSVAIKAPGTSGSVTPKTTSPKAKPATASAPSVVAPTRILENGQYVNVVSLTNNGFVPQTVTIGKGESVRFVNRSGYAMRIISTIASPEYSGLNQRKVSALAVPTPSPSRNRVPTPSGTVKRPR